MFALFIKTTWPALIRKGLVFCALTLRDPAYHGFGIACSIKFPFFLTTRIIPSFFANFFLTHRLRKDHLPLSPDRWPPTVVHASIPPPTIPIPYHVIVSLLCDAPILKPLPKPTKTYTNSSPTHSTLIGIISPEVFNAFPRRHSGPGVTLWDAVLTVSEGGFVRPNGSERVRRYVWAMPNLNLRLGWKMNRLSRRRGRGGRKWKSCESFDAGTSSPPLAHVDSQHVGSHLSPLGNNAVSSSCAHSSPGLPWCSSTKLERDGPGYDFRCAKILG